MVHRIRPVAVTALSGIVALCLLVPGRAEANTVRATTAPSTRANTQNARATTAPSAAFTFPASGLTSYGTPTGWSVEWDAAGTFSTQRLTEASAPPNADGGCASVSYADGAVHDAATSPVAVTGDPGSCYRYRVDLLDHAGAVLATATSGDMLGLTAWTGRVDVFRRGEFATQLTWTWCVAASVQIMLNEIRGRHDHGRYGQAAIMRYARHHDRYYRNPIRGSDPQGWAAALNHFNGGSGYRVHADYNFSRAVHDAALRLRLTEHPVGLLVETGNHAWVMSGFKATADPALTNNYKVTAVYIEGPLFPKQRAAFGYDMAPDTRLSMAHLRVFLRRYDDRRARTAWNKRFVTIQP